jgi:hypothetical protein
MKKWYKIAGYAILLISFLSWGFILIIPWLNLSKKEIAGITAALIIVGEITFYAGILILGKSILVKIKKILMFWKKQKEV